MPSLEDLSAAIGAIHDAGLDGSFWPAALGRLGRLFDSRGATVWLQNRDGAFRDVCTTEQEGAMVRDYMAHYGALDRLRPAIERSAPGTILVNAMVVAPSDFIRTEFYADFARPHDADDGMEAHVFAGPGYHGYVGVARSSRAGAFEREDVRVLELLLPHLRRAMRTQLRLASLDIGQDSARDALDRLGQGVLIMDAKARVVHANDAAEAMLRKADGLGVEAATGRLRAAMPGQTDALRRLIAQAANRHGDGLSGAGGDNGALRIDRADGASPLLLCAAPLRAEAAWNVVPRPAVLLLVIAPREEIASPALLRSLYGLTPAEAAVASHVAQGQGIKDAADTLGVTPGTLRWHLQRVFDKTGTARQAELARLVERLDAVAVDDPGYTKAASRGGRLAR